MFRNIEKSNSEQNRAQIESILDGARLSQIEDNSVKTESDSLCNKNTSDTADVTATQSGTSYESTATPLDIDREQEPAIQDDNIALQVARPHPTENGYKTSPSDIVPGEVPLLSPAVHGDYELEKSDKIVTIIRAGTLDPNVHKIEHHSDELGKASDDAESLDRAPLSINTSADSIHPLEPTSVLGNECFPAVPPIPQHIATNQLSSAPDTPHILSNDVASLSPTAGVSEGASVNLPGKITKKRESVALVKDGNAKHRLTAAVAVTRTDMSEAKPDTVASSSLERRPHIKRFESDGSRRSMPLSSRPPREYSRHKITELRSRRSYATKMSTEPQDEARIHLQQEKREGQQHQQPSRDRPEPNRDDFKDS